MKKMNNNLTNKCFNEEIEYSINEIDNINKELYEKNLCYKRNNKIKFKFVGFVINNNNLLIVFPKTYKIPDNENILKKHIKLLAEVLLKYRESGDLYKEEKELLGSPDNKYTNNIASALWIIKDYINNGYIRRRKKETKINRGNNVDWNKTVKKKQPYFYDNKPYYFDLIVKESQVDNEHFLYQLHQYSVKKSFNKYGWIYGLNNFSGKYNINKSSIDVNFADYILKKELRKTFVHREINLIKNIREFIIGTSNENIKTDLDIFASQYFYNIWEKMCGKLFNNEYDVLKNYIPNPVWRIKNNKDKHRTQIPDIIYRDNDNNKEIYILDAKYYNIKKSLPGWHDLVKQFYYYYSIKENKNIKKVHNILLMPEVVNNKTQIKYFGYVEIEKYQKLGKVYGILIDIRAVMEHYIDKNSISNMRSKLKNKIRTIKK